MKKIFMTFFALLLLSSMVYAADFVPVNKLDIDVPDFVQYDFDGKPVDIPVGVDGTPARAYLVIETTGLAETMPRIRNGRIGWHTVNGIDTTIYNSTGEDLQPGQKYITWPGVDNDGNAVPEGEYTYHVWAFDYMNLYQPVMPMADYDRMNAHSRLYLQTTDQDGSELPKPWISAVCKGIDMGIGETEVHSMWGRWSLGNDPYNPELIETSEIPLPEGWNAAQPGSFSRSPYDPEDFNYIFHWTATLETNQQELRKFKLVPNDVAEEITDWGPDLTWGYEIMNHQQGGLALVQDTYIILPTWLYSKATANPYLLVSTVDGDKVEDIYLDEIDKIAYVQELGEPVLVAGGIHSVMAFMNKSRILTGSIWCFHSVLDPVRYFESGDYEDLVLAINEEGDGYQDKGWSTDNPFPDYCFGEDPPWNYGPWGGEDGFVTISTNDGGPLSWCLYAPDMTALGYCSKAGENDQGSIGTMTLSTGSPYDGIYTRPRDWKNSEGKEEGEEIISLTYLGYDSDRGTISKEGGVGVAAAAPAAFSVAQNVPNPCNPTTTINYTIPETGNVTVDVFNVAGQKVDTLVNNHLDAGSHSVVWDGSSKSSGVYFYTVTSGELSKTMKMTLLK